ncbi:hypothetical protein [Roseovarius sp.]|uniref:hypothetical protein n=1 Tax=Roseovarius sp. TaxID=1486281 RepID=UPI003A97B2CD
MLEALHHLLDADYSPDLCKFSVCIGLGERPISAGIYHHSFCANQMSLREEEEKMEGAQRPQASASERAGVMMKVFDARSLLDGLTSSWTNPARREGRTVNLRKPPPDLIALAHRSRTFEPMKTILNVQEKP